MDQDSARVATAADAAAVTETFTLGFHQDPTWSWAFPDPDRRPEHYRAWWGLHVEGALGHDWVWLTEGCGAAALWVPPGQPELTEEGEARAEPMLREMLGGHADQVLVLLDRFHRSHPEHPPHYYLSLLATHPDHRGRGEGMGLLAQNLARIDEEGMPAYLESSNPANNHRYERLGFVQVGEFSAPGGGPTVATMWREPR